VAKIRKKGRKIIKYLFSVKKRVKKRLAGIKNATNTPRKPGYFLYEARTHSTNGIVRSPRNSLKNTD